MPAEGHALHHDHRREQDGERGRRQAGRRLQLHRQALQRRDAAREDREGDGPCLTARLRRPRPGPDRGGGPRRLGSLSGAMTARPRRRCSRSWRRSAARSKRAKSEIAALRSTTSTDSHIPAATDELDAMVEHTAEATNEILDSCETLEALQATLSRRGGGDGRRRRHPHLRGLQLPGHHRPAHRQGGRGAEGDRGSASPPSPAASPGREAEAAPAAEDARTEGARLANGPQLPRREPRRRRSTGCWRVSTDAPALACLLALLLPGLAAARRVPVRAGDHPGPWAAGLRLALPAPPTALDQQGDRSAALPEPRHFDLAAAAQAAAQPAGRGGGGRRASRLTPAPAAAARLPARRAGGVDLLDPPAAGAARLPRPEPPVREPRAAVAPRAQPRLRRAQRGARRSAGPPPAVAPRRAAPRRASPPSPRPPAAPCRPPGRGTAAGARQTAPARAAALRRWYRCRGAAAGRVLAVVRQRRGPDLGRCAATRSSAAAGGSAARRHAAAPAAGAAGHRAPRDARRLGAGSRPRRRPPGRAAPRRYSSRAGPPARLLLRAARFPPQRRRCRSGNRRPLLVGTVRDGREATPRRPARRRDSTCCRHGSAPPSCRAPTTVTLRAQATAFVAAPDRRAAGAGRRPVARMARHRLTRSLRPSGRAVARTAGAARALQRRHRRPRRRSARHAARRATARRCSALGLRAEAQSMAALALSEDPRAGGRPAPRCAARRRRAAGGTAGGGDGLLRPPPARERRAGSSGAPPLAAARGDARLRPRLAATLPCCLTASAARLRGAAAAAAALALAEAGETAAARPPLAGPGRASRRFALPRAMLDGDEGCPEALDGYDRVAQGRDRPDRARALRRAMELRLAAGQIDAAGAAGRWRRCCSPGAAMPRKWRRGCGWRNCGASRRCTRRAGAAARDRGAVPRPRGAAAASDGRGVPGRLGTGNAAFDAWRCSTPIPNCCRPTAGRGDRADAGGAAGRARPAGSCARPCWAGG